jgi:hypothetical protein
MEADVKICERWKGRRKHEENHKSMDSNAPEPYDGPDAAAIDGFRGR